MKTTVYYDYFEGQQVPIWFVIYIEGEIDWDDEYFYFSIEAPFELKDSGNFDPDVLSATVTMGDLTRCLDQINTIGISLPRLKQTIQDFGGSVDEVQQFIIQVADVEEMLQFNAIRDHFSW